MLRIYRQTLAAYWTPQSAVIFYDKNLTPVGQQMPKTLLVHRLKNVKFSSISHNQKFTVLKLVWPKS
jgi:hypothetical protein